MAKFSKSAIAKQISAFHGQAKLTDTEFDNIIKNLLTYVYFDFAEENKCNDVASINDFIRPLKPAYKRVAVQFLPKFIGWDWDNTEQFFGKKHAKKKNYDSKKAKAKEFYDSGKSVWEWFEENGTKPKAKATDYKKSVGNALTKAFAAKDDDGKPAFTMKDLVNVLRAQDTDMRQLMKLIELAAEFEEA